MVTQKRKLKGKRNLGNLGDLEIETTQLNGKDVLKKQDCVKELKCKKNVSLVSCRSVIRAGSGHTPFTLVASPVEPQSLLFRGRRKEENGDFVRLGHEVTEHAKRGKDESTIACRETIPKCAKIATWLRHAGLK
ncbi:7963_t:CDS:2 [Scutellospora calospora]|uniref:7963_t:CDS:1 n=1 Tax=Scutellospora calospora TaxID=85575 RepID=A0ACA9KHY3_9GLOM|nr:7963_t:CDS:2 [Scutellospora calospora]